MTNLTRKDIEEIAERVAEEAAEKASERAITKYMLALGVDISTPEAVLRAQSMMKHLGRQYDACETVTQYSLKTAIGVVVTAIIGYFLLMLNIPKK